MIDDIMKLIAVIGLVIAIIFLGFLSYNEYQEYKIYKEFCQDKDICYCESLNCEFRTQRTEKYINGELISNELSNETKELCNLAKELDDKEVMFRGECE